MTSSSPQDELCGWFVLLVGATGFVLTILGLILTNGLLVLVGVVFVVACIMGEELSHFHVGRGRVTMRARARPGRRR